MWLRTLVGLLVSGTFCLGWSSPPTVSPKSRPWMSDPVFGLEFDTARVKYEPTPGDVLTECFGPKSGLEWTFAHVRHGGSEYLVVMVIPGGGEGDVFGSAVSLVGGQCEVEPSNWMISGFVPKDGYSGAGGPRLPGLGAPPVCDPGALGDCHYFLRSAAEETILRALVKDALKRGVRAWGSDAAFRTVACRPNLIANHIGHPVLQQELSSFCKR
jgi:hypothetical protein